MIQVGSCVPQGAVEFLVQHTVCRAIGGSHVFRRSAPLALHDPRIVLMLDTSTQPYLPHPAVCH